MIRRFNFEDEVHHSLACVPMAVRRKLDRIGVKVSLEQWQALAQHERLAVCHLPTDSDEERDTVKTFVEESVKTRTGTVTKTLSEEVKRSAEPPDAPPTRLIENARVGGCHSGPADMGSARRRRALRVDQTGWRSRAQSQFRRGAARVDRIDQRSANFGRAPRIIDQSVGACAPCSLTRARSFTSLDQIAGAEAFGELSIDSGEHCFRPHRGGPASRAGWQAKWSRAIRTGERADARRLRSLCGMRPRPRRRHSGRCACAKFRLASDGYPPATRPTRPRSGPFSISVSIASASSARPRRPSASA